MGTREMKDSGIEWIGMIPKEWEVKKLGIFFKQRNEKVSDKEFMPLSVTMKGILPQLENAAKTNDGDNRKLVREGDFAINSRSDRRGSCGISPYTGSVSLINTVLTPLDNIDSIYYNWLFHTSMFADEYYKWGHGIVDDLWTTRWSEMKSIAVTVPSLHEQQRIATFLDEKCKDIDTLITLQEEMIAELQAYKQSVISEAVTKGLNPNVPMKDSGVEWIGEIPEHWEICRLKNKVTLNPNINSVLKNNDIVSFMPMQCLRNDIIIPHEAIYENVKNYTHFQNGDIVMAKVTPCFENGNIAIANNLVNDNGFGTSEIFVLRCSDSYNKRYFFYYLQIPYIKGVGCASMTGTGGLKRVNPTILSTSKLLTPPLSEQQAIADYLDTKCSQIDELIALKQQKITELQDYKKSLIYEYVTGKKEVPANN